MRLELVAKNIEDVVDGIREVEERVSANGHQISRD